MSRVKAFLNLFISGTTFTRAAENDIVITSFLTCDNVVVESFICKD